MKNLSFLTIKWQRVVLLKVFYLFLIVYLLKNIKILLVMKFTFVIMS